MSGPSLSRIETVLHPTDFSEASEVAFAHALAIALVAQSSLTLLHAGSRTVENWERFPGVRSTLSRWGLLAPGSPKRAVMEQLRVAVTKIDADGDPLKTCLQVVAEEEPDLVVFATEQRSGLARWLRPSTAQIVARRTGSLALFVPEGCRPMVALSDGALSLARILMPVDHSPRIERALHNAVRFAHAFGTRPVALTCLHVGDGVPRLPTREPDDAITVESALAKGPVVETILEAAGEADLLVMPTDGRDGLLDAFRGSVTERVVREAPCPVLVVPSPT